MKINLADQILLANFYSLHTTNYNNTKKKKN